MHQSIHNHCKLKVFGVLHAIGLGIWDQSHFGNKPPKTTIFVHICAQFGSLKVYIILIVFVVIRASNRLQIMVLMKKSITVAKTQKKHIAVPSGGENLFFDIIP